MLTPEYYARQTGLIDPELLTQNIALIGAGGIGSWTALALGKLGCQNVVVFDFDTVEEQNIGCQIYTEGDLGRPKVEALQEKLFALIENPPHPVNQRIEKEQLGDFDVVIMAVDDIEVRQKIFEAQKGSKNVLIDGRMAGNALQIFTVHMDSEEDVKFYESTLFPKEEAIETPCTERAVVYNVFVVAGFITDIVARLAKKLEVPKEIIVDLANFYMEA